MGRKLLPPEQKRVTTSIRFKKEVEVALNKASVEWGKRKSTIVNDILELYFKQI